MTAAVHPPAALARRGPFLGWLRLVRPRHATKNLFCLAGVMFGPGRPTDSHAWALGLATMSLFVLMSSGVYILNDIIDRDRDLVHPLKRTRPIASGEIKPLPAVLVAAALAVLALAGAWTIGPAVLACLVLYLANNVAYSLLLKGVALLDVLCISFGFVLRLLAGIYAVGDLPTAWISLCTFSLSLFLGFCKRRSEMARFITSPGQHQRPALCNYSLPYLDSMVCGTSILAVICYSLFTTATYKNPTLVVTVPIVFFSVMHYKRLVIVEELGEEPDLIVTRDLPLLASAVLWSVCYFLITISDLHLFLMI